MKKGLFMSVLGTIAVVTLGITGCGTTTQAATSSVTTVSSTSTTSTPTSPKHFRKSDHNFVDFEELGQILHLSPSALRADIKAKESLAVIAQKQGVSIQTLTTALEASFKKRLDEAVSSGHMTATEEQKQLSRFDAHVSMMITSTKM
ncbi:hypothetical protein [Sulfoacidibacillus ferrooxidans]|uniref:Lipoprotein n=1 Tax=Sulfoacidibacillus ferrooxidans TaxID=2005001 RepID=A0A9X1VCK5_9BACL|nr:hypothetical protein [Sulfoacidibacillus ferrooxidans]MCI0184835.1 hypothetical protein [Sulfoacidibacillus ferrooxidans]